jgi:hypothetical protein
MIRLFAAPSGLRWARFGRSIVFVTCACVGLHAGGAAADQSLSLRGGWNLISLSMEPGSASIEEVLGGLPPLRLVGVYGFDGNLGAGGEWSRYAPGLPPEQAWVNSLQQMEAAAGYWVLLSQGPQVELIVSGSVGGPGPRVLQAGWHLLGFSNTEARVWHDVLGPAAFAVDAVYGFDASSGTFMGFEDPSFGNVDVNGDGVVEPSEYGWTYGEEHGVLRVFEPGAAYWLHLDRSTQVGSVLEVELESDVDAHPPGGGASNSWDPAGDDTDLNGTGLLDYGYTVTGEFDGYGNPIVNTQDTIWFRIPKGSDQPWPLTEQRMSMVNRGTGALVFEVDAQIPGLVVSPTSGEVLPGGRSVVTLRIDGTQLAGLTDDITESLVVRSNGGTRSIEVKISPPRIEGDYAGSVNVYEVAGKSLELGRWPFGLTLDPGGGGTLRAAGAPHFPQDVTLSGTVTGANFEATGTIGYVAGDAANPYGVDVIRSIRFEGGVSDAEGLASADGVLLGLRGDYYETVTGPPGGPIELRGAFLAIPESE